MQWQAERATGAWFGTVVRALAQIHQTECLSMINVTTASRSSATMALDHPVASEQWFCDEMSRVQDFWNALIDISAARCWSQMQFSICSPNNLVAALHSDEPTARSALSLQKKVWEAVLQAEQAVKRHDLPKCIRSEINARLQDVAWHNLQCAREAFLVCQSGNWEPKDSEIKTLAF